MSASAEALTSHSLPVMTPQVEAAPALSLRLRTETRDMHDRIEANSRFSRLMAPDLGLAEYRALLLGLYGHHAAAEAALAAAPGMPPALGLSARLRRNAALALDLRALGLSDADITAVPRCTAYHISNAEAAWGTLYVLEGSTLGGQLIARHLAATLGLGPETGAAGLVPHGTQTGALWREFRTLMDQAAAQREIEPDAVIAAARFAFSTLDEWVAQA
jgi:heme oxygenase